MSCSKIFSGDLPEITYYIIKNFQNDFSTLYSCILVNRLWCRLAIPLLWENPFSITNRRVNNIGDHKFIEIYLYNLNSDLKSKLNEYKINDNLLPSNTLFNYPNFIKYLNTSNIIQSIKKWTAVKVIKDLDSESEFRRLIQTSLFKVFIENEVKLHTLEIEVFSSSNYNSYNYDILELILQNTNFIHNIINLKPYIFSEEDKLMEKSCITNNLFTSKS
ncbi:uncharacterized protein OCT59_027047 [Rhizophagus irregularis]|nr:hypothetical protein OCT59_027047 [Rhizophagus irregularis]